MKNTVEESFPIFAKLAQLIHFGVKQADKQKTKKIWQKDIFSHLNKVLYGFDRVFLPPNTNIICVKFDESNPFLKYPFQLASTVHLYGHNGWQRMLSEANLEAKLPIDSMFFQFKFEKPFLFKDELGNVVDMVYGVGLFAKNIVQDNKHKIVFGYGLHHTGGRNKKSLDYDILDSVHVLSTTNKKTKINRCDFNLKPNDDGENTRLSEFENHLLTRVVSIIILHDRGLLNSFQVGQFTTGKKTK